MPRGGPGGLRRAQPDVDERRPRPAERAALPVLSPPFGWQRASSAPGRLALLDGLRGLAILLMTLDHCASIGRISLIAERYQSRPLELPPWPFWALGLLTNIAAPTFWVVSGISVALLARRMRGRGQDERAVSAFLVTRAGVLLLIDALLVSFLWAPVLRLRHQYCFDLLSSLSVSLVILAAVRRLPAAAVGALGLALLALYPALSAAVPTGWREAGGFWLAIWIDHLGGAHPVVSFPVLAWCGLMLVGYALGGVIDRPAWRRPRPWLLAGGGLLAAWLAVRLANGYGNLTGWDPARGFSDLLIMSKGPPDPAFMLFNLGGASLLAALLCVPAARLDRGWLIDLGRASLFVYVLHLIVYKGLAWIGLGLLPGETGLRLVVTWLAGVAILVPLARAWRVAKECHHAVLQYL